LRDRCVIENLNLDGTIEIRGSQNPNEPKTFSNLQECSKNVFNLVPTEESDPQYLLIRGYKSDEAKNTIKIIE